MRFTLLTATLLFVLSLNHQAVATLRLPSGKVTRVGQAPKVAVVKQKVMLEATASLALWVAPAAQAWLPETDFLAGLLPRRVLAFSVARARPCALPNLFRTRLLIAALSPHAP
ncbi:hypothetical protein LJY25_10215 [Hymenobacter sp. BT175]|nr:hypothetical protein [Hymenobacter translucens]